MSKSEQTRVCIIGVNGGIGSRLAKHLAADDRVEVVGVDRHAVPATEYCREYVATDLVACLSESSLRDHLSNVMSECDGVVLLAGAVHDRNIDPEIYQQLNVNVPEMVLFEYGRRRNTPGRFVFSSTIAVYGDRPVREVTEEDDLSPATPYAESKARGEQALLSIAATYENISLTVLRLGTLINKNDCGNLARLIRAGKKYRILPRVNHGISKSFVDIKDVCTVMQVSLLSDQPVEGVFNVLGPPVGLHEILDCVADTIEQCFRPPLPTWLLKRLSPTMAQSVAVSGRRTEQVFGITLAGFRDAFQREFMTDVEDNR